MRTVGLISLGCPRNLVDSQAMLNVFKGKKFNIVEEIANADIAIVNTCAFIKEAKEESIKTILDLVDFKKEGKIKKIIVAGCLSQRYGEDLVPELREIDAFIGKFPSEEVSSHSRKIRLTPKHFAYVKISEGCINECSYCVIPKIKGRLQSRTIKSIVDQIKQLDKEGVSEINLIGQDVTSYGFDIYKKYAIVALLKEILRSIKNTQWIRLLYTHPNHITDELIDLIAREKRICNYIDLPIQHINSRILKLMNRNITKERIVDLIKTIRAKIPDVIIRTSVIVGFPSETEEEFQELLDFIEKVKFERLGAFVYSREEDTKAFSFRDQIPEETKIKRFDAVMNKQQEISLKVQEEFLGREIEVLIDEKKPKENTYIGRTYADAPEVDGQVFINTSKKLKLGDFVKVKIKDTLEYDLVGEVI